MDTGDQVPEGMLEAMGAQIGCRRWISPCPCVAFSFSHLFPAARVAGEAFDRGSGALLMRMA